jgi:hypothetical protein
MVGAETRYKKQSTTGVVEWFINQWGVTFHGYLQLAAIRAIDARRRAPPGC